MSAKSAHGTLGSGGTKKIFFQKFSSKRLTSPNVYDILIGLSARQSLLYGLSIYRDKYLWRNGNRKRSISAAAHEYASE